jgi:hypothetical protein
MSTAPAPTPPAAPPHRRELVIYSHCSLFYWWPVWVAGFIMALVTAFSGQVLAVLPAGTKPALDQKLNVDEGEVKRDILYLPKDKHLAKDQKGEARPPRLHVTRSKNVGVLFCTILLLVIFITNVPLRGLWSVIIIGTIIFLSIIFAILGWWDNILTYLSFLDIRINLGGYLFISIVLFILWCIIFFFFDKQVYTVIAPAEVRVKHAIGEGEEVFNAAGFVARKERSDLFRHMILGFGSGDLVLRPVGEKEIHLPNVLSAGRRIRQIQEILSAREVVPGQRVEPG